MLLIAMVAPRMIAVNSAGSGGAVSAVLLFALPMAAILAISSVVVIRAFILARREDLRMRWTAYLPLSVFLLGIASTLLLVYATTV